MNCFDTSARVVDFDGAAVCCAVVCDELVCGDGQKIQRSAVRFSRQRVINVPNHVARVQNTRLRIGPLWTTVQKDPLYGWLLSLFLCSFRPCFCSKYGRNEASTSVFISGFAIIFLVLCSLLPGHLPSLGFCSDKNQYDFLTSGCSHVTNHRGLVLPPLFFPPE